MHQEADRRPYLDGLRGVAAFIVLVGHTTITFCYPLNTLSGDVPILIAIGKSPLGIFWKGNAAVCIFFVLSGFVMAQMSEHAKLNFVALALRRYVRLAVPILITSAFAYLLLRCGLYRNREAAEIVHSGWLQHWYQFAPSGTTMVYESLVGTFWTGSAAYNSNLWTMRPELIGSLIVIALFSILDRKRDRVTLLAAFLVLAYFLSDYLALFAVGGLFFQLGPYINRLRPASWLLFGAGLYFCSMPAAKPDDPLPWFDFLPRLSTAANAQYWHEVGATLVVGAVLSSTALRELLMMRVPQFLGRISFTLYLIHLPLLCGPVSWLITAMAGQDRITIAALGIPFALSLATAAAAATHGFVDGWPVRISRSVGTIWGQILERHTNEKIATSS